MEGVQRLRSANFSLPSKPEDDVISISSTEDCLVVDCGDTLSFETQDDIDADTEYASPSPCIQNSSTSASSIICSISRISPSRKRRRGSRESSGDGRKSNTRRCQFSEPSIDYYNIVSDDDLDGTPLNVPDNVEGFYPSNLLISDDKSPPFTDSRSRKRPSNIDDEVLKHRELTRATPLIRKLAGNLFGQTIAPIEINGSDNGHSGLVSECELGNITCDPAELRRQFYKAIQINSFRNISTITLKCHFWSELDDGPELQKGYRFVVIDGKIYQPGDHVLIRPNSPQRPHNDEAGISHQPTRIRFGRIAYLYEDHNGMYAHVRWFAHGSEVPVLQDFASPRALFMLSSCQDIQLTKIVGKLRVDYVGKDDAEVGLVENRFTDVNHFFYQFCFELESNTISDAPTPIDDSLLMKLEGKYCGCCNESKEKDNFSNVVLPTKAVASDGSMSGFRFRGVNYHVYDFVYSMPTKGYLADILQILDITFKIKDRKRCFESKADFPATNVQLSVRILQRAEELCKTHGLRANKFQDNRKVLMSNIIREISAADLEGKCYVRHIDEIDDLSGYKDEPDNFWLKKKVFFANGSWDSMIDNVEILDPSTMRYSQETKEELASLRQAENRYLSKCQLPQGLELFCGVGGLTLGMHESGAVNTKDAVDFSPAATKTAAENMPWLKTHTMDISTFLTKVLEAEIRISSQTDVFEALKRRVPKRGDVQFVSAGPPCPGYSTNNASPRADDIKNTLILPFLSAVELYRPAYVLLENVTGILSHRLGATQAGRKTEGGIPQGTLKFIFRALTAMGYQVQYAVLQAGEYAIPQSRNRVFFWAALQGYKLPNFPQATTTFGRRTASWHLTRGPVPHRGYTVADATSDLPRWELKNPHNVIPASQEELEDRAKRAEDIEQIRVYPGDNYVGHNEQDYATSPCNEFQRKMRAGISKLTNHVTEAWYDKPSWRKRTNALSGARTEQVCNIGFGPDDDFRSLPPKLQPWFLSHPDSAAAKKDFDFVRGRFGRLKANEPFSICLTTTEPARKGSRILHHELHRILAIREYARAQGFPDWFLWDLNSTLIKLVYRMIGNAVPVTLATELGRELLKILISQFEAGSSMPLFQQRNPSKALAEAQKKLEEEPEQTWKGAKERSIRKLEKDVKILDERLTKECDWMRKKGYSIENAIDLDDEHQFIVID